jgi:predicted secreted protein
MPTSGLAVVAARRHTRLMGWISGIVVYFLIWWVALFAVLPIGTRPEPAGDPESGWRGTPERPQLLRKVVITTLVTTVLWLGVYLVIESEWLSFRSGWLAMPEK